MLWSKIETYWEAPLLCPLKDSLFKRIYERAMGIWRLRIKMEKTRIFRKIFQRFFHEFRSVLPSTNSENFKLSSCVNLFNKRCPFNQSNDELSIRLTSPSKGVPQKILWKTDIIDDPVTIMDSAISSIALLTPIGFRQSNKIKKPLKIENSKFISSPLNPEP